MWPYELHLAWCNETEPHNKFCLYQRVTPIPSGSISKREAKSDYVKKLEIRSTKFETNLNDQNSNDRNEIANIIHFPFVLNV